jgi:hypothetical protein
MIPILHKTILLLAACFLVLAILPSCENKEPESNWGQVKENAKATYDSAVALSAEKWSELKEFSEREWNLTSETVEELSERIHNTGQAISPKAQELLKEVEVLKEQVEKQMKQFAESHGDKVESSRQALEATWEKLKEKTEALRKSL